VNGQDGVGKDSAVLWLLVTTGVAVNNGRHDVFKHFLVAHEQLVFGEIPTEWVIDMRIGTSLVKHKVWLEGVDVCNGFVQPCLKFKRFLLGSVTVKVAARAKVQDV